MTLTLSTTWRLYDASSNLTEKSLLRFYSKSSSNVKILSNFVDMPVNVNGRQYATGEHAFHGEKYNIASTKSTLGDKRREELLNYAKTFTLDVAKYNSAAEAKRAGGKRGLCLNADELHAWNDTQSKKIQYAICKYKAHEYHQVRQILDGNRKQIDSSGQSCKFQNHLGCSCQRWTINWSQSTW